VDWRDSTVGLVPISIMIVVLPSLIGMRLGTPIAAPADLADRSP